MQLDESRKFLLVFPNEEERNNVAEKIDRHLERTQFFYASNTSDAKARIATDRPHIVMFKTTALGIDGHEIVEYLLSHKESKKTPIVFIGEIPDEEIYIDEVGKGRVHFLDDICDDEKLSQCLSRVLNYVTHSDADDSFHLKFLSPGDFLMHAGADAEYVYIVRKGSLEASVTRNGERIILGPVDTGEFVGEMAFINGEIRSADVSAVTDCELIQIPIKLMDKVLLYKPTWSKSLMRTLARRMKLADERLA